MEINLDYLNACKLLLPSSDTVDLTLVGCGGTGSWLAPSVVRIARLLKEKFGKTVNVSFVDPDRVEPKNCYRQNFCEAEVGRNKADALASRYGMAWGIEVAALTARLETYQFNLTRSLGVLIGCVDRSSARRELLAAAKKMRVWWLDCGNAQSSGQILLGSGIPKLRNPFELPGFCSWLPLPTDHHPELLEDPETPEAKDKNLSCADMAMRDSQGLAINQRIAAEASDYLVRLLLTHDLVKYATYLDLASGSTRSKYITPAMLAEGQTRETISRDQDPFRGLNHRRREA